MSMRSLIVPSCAKAGSLNVSRQMSTPNATSWLGCFSRRQHAHDTPTIGEVSRTGSRWRLKVLSRFPCRSHGSVSTLNSITVTRNSIATVQQPARRGRSNETGKLDQRILLRIVMWGGPNTLLLLVPFDAAAETVVEMILNLYVKGARGVEPDTYQLFCAHCNSPALHPKQQIGSVGSKHFLLCKRGPPIFDSNYFTSQAQVARHSHTSSQSQSSSRFLLTTQKRRLKHSRCTSFPQSSERPFFSNHYNLSPTSSPSSACQARTSSSLSNSSHPCTSHQHSKGL